VVEPVLQKNGDSIYYINISKDDFKLGGSSFAQTLASIGNEAPTIKDASYLSTVFNSIQKLISENQILAGHDVASGGLITTLLEMCFADINLGAKLNLTDLGEEDLIKILFSENNGIVFQGKKDSIIEETLANNNIDFIKIGTVTETESLQIKHIDQNLELSIPEMRKVWFETSYFLDQKQSGEVKAKERFDNYTRQPLNFKFPDHFTGKLPVFDKNYRRPKAAIIREKGSNSEREMANAMYLAGFDVKDVHMTDLIEGRETLKDIKFIAAVGGFSNSDVLGSAKGWAGAFLYNKKAKNALKNFFAKEDTLSLGVCNGCQLFIELGLLNPEHKEKPKMLHNDSGKFECSFTSVEIKNNNSIMLSSLAGTNLGIWAAHGEGKFSFPKPETDYNIVGKYSYDGFPSNPNGSDFNTAMLADSSGRHLVMMPHLERSTFSWNWAHYPKNRKDEVTPWLEAFINARKWLENKS
jgi:phosphoribosylformylglycinamidine synthase